MKILDTNNVEDIDTTINLYGGYFNFLEFVNDFDILLRAEENKVIQLNTEEVGVSFNYDDIEEMLSKYRKYKDIFVHDDLVVIRENKCIMFQEFDFKNCQNILFTAKNVYNAFNKSGTIKGIIELFDENDQSYGFVSSSSLRFASQEEIKNGHRIIL